MTIKTVSRSNVQHSSRRAFTLVELLVVIAIIGILVGLLMPAVMNAQNEARRAQCQENLRNVAMALVNFESAKNFFPGYINTFRGLNNVTWYTMILQESTHFLCDRIILIVIKAFLYIIFGKDVR